MSNRVTMSDVTREAGGPLMTVSRVINNKGAVSSETRQCILEIISEPGYRPRAIARSLATKETSTIGLVAAQDSLDTVNLDTDRCGRIAAEHLVRSGHKRIGMVSGPPASYSGEGHRGFLAALREAGIELLDGWIQPCQRQPSVEGGHEATRHFLGMYPRLMALFCFNDLVAKYTIRLMDFLFSFNSVSYCIIFCVNRSKDNKTLRGDCVVA